MGMDLKLLPFCGDGITSNFSHTVLDCPRNYDVFEKVRKIPQMPVDDDFNSYFSDELHYGQTHETPYGYRLTWCRAKDLKKCGFTGPVGAYLEKLKDRHKVALYWC
jgi:hypothetical protein